jgi:multisubunit Na+/H+ antiporter MnhF subunit
MLICWALVRAVLRLVRVNNIQRRSVARNVCKVRIAFSLQVV